MRKASLFSLCVLSLIGNFLPASASAYEPIGTNGRNSAASKYYRGEISSDQYLDSTIGPMNTPSQGYYHGKIEPNQFGGGYDYSDTNGTHRAYRPNQFGGWDVNGN